jgi:alkylation response protein AidB-like acyl-CoA dehydrogenase
MYAFQLSEERRHFQEMARQFAVKEIKPFNDKFEDDWDTHKYMSTLLAKAAELGFMGLVIDEKYGGTGAVLSEIRGLPKRPLSLPLMASRESASFGRWRPEKRSILVASA